MIPNTILDYELKLENEIQAEWNEWILFVTLMWWVFGSTQWP